MNRRQPVRPAAVPRLGAGLLVTAVALMLSACGEPTQTAKPSAKRVDAPPYSGTDNKFAEPGWTKGDKASWEAHLRTRAQRGQNDYARIN
jgi:hypothetical protein